MGLTNAILRFVILAKTPEEEYGYYKYVIKKGTIFNTLLILLVGLIFYYYPFPERFISIRWLLIIILLTLPFQFLIDTNIFTYRAKFSNKRFAITTFLISTILINSKYLAAKLCDLIGVVLANVIVNSIIGLMLCFITYKIYFNGYQSIVISRNHEKIINKYSIQYMITNGIWAIFMLNDIFLLGIFTKSPTVIADYKVAYVLPGNLAIISSAIGIFVAPFFVKHESNHVWVKRNYVKVIGINAFLMGILVVILIILAKPLIRFLYGPEYQNVADIMRLLLIAGFINSGLRYTTANLLAAMGQIKYNMIVSIIGVLLQIIINILLIPRYGAIGVAWTSVVIYLIMAVTLFFVFAKKYKMFQGI